MEPGYLWGAEEAGTRLLLFSGSQGPGAGSAGSHGDLAADGEDSGHGEGSAAPQHDGLGREGLSRVGSTNSSPCTAGRL